MKDAYTAYTLVVTLYTVNLVGVKSRKKYQLHRQVRGESFIEEYKLSARRYLFSRTV